MNSFITINTLCACQQIKYQQRMMHFIIVIVTFPVPTDANTPCPKTRVNTFVLFHTDKHLVQFSCLGTVIEKHRDSQQYTIQWADGSRSAQQTIHMFGAFSHLPQPSLHCHVLACSDPVELKFLPGTVTKCLEGTYTVKFYDGTRSVVVM